MNLRFTIDRLVVRGIGVPDADLDFSKDVTVVSGLSNTGKTYVFQCLKYLLGNDVIPKRIDESLEYDKAYLEIQLSDGSYNTVYRSLTGGHAMMYQCTVDALPSYSKEPELLLANSKATLKNRTLSDYYCSLVGLENKRVRKNADGVTANAGFALMRHLSVIDEVDIIKEGSPILGGQLIHKTKEKSFLKLLLIGQDDSSIVAKPKANVINNRKGKLEVIEALIEEYQNELGEFSVISEDELPNQIEKLEEAISKENTQLKSLFEKVALVELKVDENWQTWKEKESRLLTVEELLVRFNLLAQHYQNDISRLEAINEASKAFSELDLGRCPICSSEFEEGHTCDIENLDELAVASEGEMLKIQRLQKDLEFNVNNLYHERTELNSEIERTKSKHIRAQESANLFRSLEIKNKVETIESYKTKIRELKSTNRIYEKLKGLTAQRDKYQGEIEPTADKDNFATLSTALLTGISDLIKELLESWEYDDEMKSVSFSEETVDFVINGNDRNLSGKGYRALTYSAFVISLLRYCIENEKPHSGVVILDSPLCTLRSKHVDSKASIVEGDVIRDEMKDSFYKDLSTSSGFGQIIIFENDGPNSESAQRMKYHEFTKGTSPGRYGFFRKT
jgi:hypothetical protein